MFLLRSFLATSLVLMTSVTWAEVPLTLDAGLLDESQVHDVWGSVVRAWESGESEQALNQAEALARAQGRSRMAGSLHSIRSGGNLQPQLSRCRAL